MHLFPHLRYMHPRSTQRPPPRPPPGGAPPLPGFWIRLLQTILAPLSNHMAVRREITRIRSEWLVLQGEILNQMDALNRFAGRLAADRQKMVEEQQADPDQLDLGVGGRESPKAALYRKAAERKRGKGKLSRFGSGPLIDAGENGQDEAAEASQ